MKSKSKHMISLASKLAGNLREQIRNGDCSFGHKLPAERELVEQSGFSRGTVRKALSILESERLILRLHGRGAFVADPTRPNLESSGTAVIGIMAYERAYYFETIIQSASSYASQLGYVMATGSNSTDELETQHVDAFIYNGIQGVMMAPRGPASYANYQRLIDKNIPVVFLDNFLPGYEEDSVIVDNWEGTLLAVRHLAELGHSRIAYIGYPKYSKLDYPCSQGRVQGYLEGCNENNFDIKDDWIIETDGENDGKNIEACATEILTKQDPPTGIVSYNDNWANHIIKAASRIGLEVPKDLSVVGFDDSILATNSKIPLTSIKPEKKELGIAAVEMLIDKIESKRSRPKRILSVTPRLVIRKSTAKAPTIKE